MIIKKLLLLLYQTSKCNRIYRFTSLRKMTTRNVSEDVSDEELKELIPDLPSGPLDKYRKMASFDFRRMRLTFDSIDNIKFKNEIYEYVKMDPLFQHSAATPTLDDARKIATRRMYAMYNKKFLTMEKIVVDPSTVAAETEATFMYDSSVAVKLSLTFRMFANVIRGMGHAHHYQYIEDVENAKIAGCFALTEIAHGSNAKGMRTRATYDPLNKEFILNSDDFEAAKAWVGSMGKNATHAVVYAMLLSKGINHGLHTFVVPLRDPYNMKPYPGVIVGDLGEKIGLNGVDNGFVMFNNYRLPFEAQLNKFGGVSEEGDYITPFKDPNKRFGASLGVLSSGRVHITNITTSYFQKAIVIAIRYSAARRQFGPDDQSTELPVIEYQQQQVRLIPYLAACYAMRIFTNWFCYEHASMTINNYTGQEENAAAKGIEIHALSSAAKPLCAWTARDGIQACREACGGHGYLKASGLGDLRNDNDANCTYEGENGILVQQASNWLLSLWPKRNEPGIVDTPFGSLEFLRNADDLLQRTVSFKAIDEVTEPKNLIMCYKWLTAYMLKTTFEKVTKLKSEGRNNFQVRNETQSFTAVPLAVIYAENYVLNHFLKTAMASTDMRIRNVLLKLVSLYGAFSLEKHMSHLYIGGYVNGNYGILLREGIIKVCSQLKPDAVSLADSLAPPDHILNSILGASDGQIYKNLQNNVMTYPGAMSRPDWWSDIVYWHTNTKSKL